MNMHDGISMILLYKNITRFILSWSQSFCGCVRDRQTEGDEWRPPYRHITSLDYTTVCYIQDPTSASRLGRYSAGGLLWNALWDAAPARHLATCWRSHDRKLRFHDDPCISRGHLYIPFHSTHKFPLNHVIASAYFQRCVLCKESRVKGQYAT